MKLRTEMLMGPYGMTITAGYSKGKYSSREHDTAVAHALMQAVQEFRQDAFGAEPYEILDAVEERASELMSEWGFDSGEVDSER